MDLIHVVLTLIVIGILLWAEEAFLPLAEPIKLIIRAVVVIATILWLVGIFFGGVPSIPVGHLR